jgi:hypothetical protein
VPRRPQLRVCCRYRYKQFWSSTRGGELPGSYLGISRTCQYLSRVSLFLFLVLVFAISTLMDTTSAVFFPFPFCAARHLRVAGTSSPRSDFFNRGWEAHHCRQTGSVTEAEINSPPFFERMESLAHQAGIRVIPRWDVKYLVPGVFARVRRIW